MAPAAAAGSATASSWIPPTLPDCEEYDGTALLDVKCYIDDHPNSTAARAATSTGVPIQVSFHAARPPLLSHFRVHCPGLDDFLESSSPKVVATDAGLVLLRVHVTHYAGTIGTWDYFLYNPRARHLRLLPNPGTKTIVDSATALLSIGGGEFAVAAIGNWGPVFARSGRTLLRWVFDLQLYRSSVGRWTTRRMSVKDLVRDAAIPLPDSVVRLYLYHETGRAFAVGGDRGTVAWVDLWRGILFLDVLANPRPVIRDVPLPVPARENWGLLRDSRNPRYIRDVAISRRRDTIKYVEMEIQPSKVVMALPNSYHEWVRGGSRRSHVIPGSWKATTWSIAAVPGGGGGSWTEWKVECEVESKDVAMDGLLSKLSGRATLPDVPVAYPTLSADDDTVYLLSSTESRGEEMVVAVDVKNKTLRGAAKLDAQKTFRSMPTYCTSEICRYLTTSTAGTAEEHERTGKLEANNATRGEKRNARVFRGAELQPAQLLWSIKQDGDK